MTIINEHFVINTNGNNDIIDITKHVQNCVYQHELKDALVCVSVQGSTSAITTIEYEKGLVQDLKEALEKLSLNDASLHFEPETSQALGFGFRCGFLGLLHMDVVQERLEREYNIDLILTAPSVIYHIYLHDGTMIELDNPAKMPDLTLVKEIQEPFVEAKIMTPKEFAFRAQ